MRKCKAGFLSALLVILLPALLLAQDQQNTPPPSEAAPNATAPGPQGRQRGAEPPCFKQAGVSDATWQQIRDIHKTTHQQMVSICENSSLSAQQKRDQIKQAFEQTEQQVHGLLTPQQQDAVKQCRQERRGDRKGMGGGMRGMRRGGGGDPCARIMRQQNKGQGAPPESSEPQQ
jgi:Spy/CpxP family protein refolding chaperone